MKFLKSIFQVGIVALLMTACATTNQTVKADKPRDQREIVVQNPMTLADILTRVPGVFVDERGAGTRVSVRGGAPLYVVDGVRIGRNYASAAHAVNVNDIVSVEVLKSPSETIIYGREASNGVVLIRTF